MALPEKKKKKKKDRVPILLPNKGGKSWRHAGKVLGHPEEMGWWMGSNDSSVNGQETMINANGNHARIRQL